MDKNDKYTDRDENQIARYEHQENLDAKRVYVVGGDFKINVESSQPLKPEIITVEKTIVVEKPVLVEKEIVVKEKEIIEVEKPIIVKEFSIEKIEIPLIQKEIELKTIQIEKPIIVKEVEYRDLKIEVNSKENKFLIPLIVLQSISILGIILVLIFK